MAVSLLLERPGLAGGIPDGPRDPGQGPEARTVIGEGAKAQICVCVGLIGDDRDTLRDGREPGGDDLEQGRSARQGPGLIGPGLVQCHPSK